MEGARRSGWERKYGRRGISTGFRPSVDRPYRHRHLQGVQHDSFNRLYCHSTQRHGSCQSRRTTSAHEEELSTASLKGNTTDSLLLDYCSIYSLLEAARGWAADTNMLNRLARQS